ncbi:MAG: TRAP transporter small permease [Rhodovibrionaceae bacterium]|nr:TRAP transporter small permease [Rhodovibrionaceae bacterium]
MRRFLNRLYLASGILGALFICAILATVALQVGLNVLDSLIAWIAGRAVGLLIPSYAEFAGFFLAAASFLALPYTLRRGGHIRVNLLLQHVPAGLRRWLEAWCTLVAAAISGYFAYYMADLVYASWRFGDVSPGMVAVPIWLPQTSLLLGLVVLTIALLDEFVTIVRGGEPSYEAQAIEGVLESLDETGDDAGKRGGG